MDLPIDRRRFLAGSGAVGFSLLLGTGQPRFAGAAGRRAGPPIRGQVIRRGAPGFLSAAHVYNERFDHVLPSLVARPLDALDTRDTVRWGVTSGISLRARSGGHSYAGYSTLSDGIVLDLRNLRQITVDPRSRTCSVGAGSQLIDVYAALATHGLTIPAGSCPSVGVAGHVLGGGIGLAARQFGLTADNLLSVQIVTADGHARTASRHRNPGLYWALRGGGGGNFGVVTSFTFRAHPVPRTVDGARLSSRDRGYLQAQLDSANCSSIPLRACHTEGTRAGGTLHRDSFQAKSDYVAQPLPARARRALVRATEVRSHQAGHGSILFDSYGGAINRVAPDATAFVHRNVLFCIQYLSYPGGLPWLRQAAGTMVPYVTGGAYFNYTDPDLKGWQSAYYGANYRRLLEIRREFDPHHYFNFPQAIGSRCSCLGYDAPVQSSPLSSSVGIAIRRAG
jgi:hypothetical protein